VEFFGKLTNKEDRLQAFQAAVESIQRDLYKEQGRPPIQSLALHTSNANSLETANQLPEMALPDNSSRSDTDSGSDLTQSSYSDGSVEEQGKEHRPGIGSSGGPSLRAQEAVANNIDSNSIPVGKITTDKKMLKSPQPRKYADGTDPLSRLETLTKTAVNRKVIRDQKKSSLSSSKTNGACNSCMLGTFSYFGFRSEDFGLGGIHKSKGSPSASTDSESFSVSSI